MNYSPISSLFRTQLAKGQQVAAYDLNQQQRDPIIVESFEFSTVISAGVGQAAPAQSYATAEPGVWIDFGLQVGSREVRMGDLVPLPAFCARKGYADGGALNGPTSVLPSGTYYEWKLKKPMVVLPGTRIYALLRFNAEGPKGTYRPVAIDVTVAMKGKALPRGPVPQTTCIPWMTSWRAPAVPIDESVISQVSPDSALANQFDDPVRIVAMYGCLATQFWAGEVVPTADVKISSSLDGYMVREATPLMELFSGRNREWAVGAVMQPKEYWTVELDYETADLLAATTDYLVTDQIQGIFGLVGYREVPLETLYRDPPEPVAEPAHPSNQPGPATARPGIQRGRPVR